MKHETDAYVGEKRAVGPKMRYPPSPTGITTSVGVLNLNAHADFEIVKMTPMAAHFVIQSRHFICFPFAESIPPFNRLTFMCLGQSTRVLHLGDRAVVICMPDCVQEG